MNKKSTNIIFGIKNLLPIFLIVLFVSIIFIGGLNKPFVGHHDWNSVVYSASARSLIGKAKTGEIFYQQDYPPLLPVSLGVSFLVFGISDWSARLVPVIFTTLTAILIYMLAKKMFKKEIGIIAAFFYLSTPLIRYFGKIPVHEAIVPFFALLIFYTYWNWFSKKIKKNFLFLILSIFAAEFAGWPGYYPILLISLHYFIFAEEKPKKKFSAISVWIGISFLSFALFILVDFLITGKMPLADLWEIFKVRTAIQAPLYEQETFNIFQFILKEALWVRVFLTKILSFLFLGGLAVLIFFKKEKRFDSRNFLLILIGVFGLIHLLLFRQLCWLHDYMIIYLFPFFCITAAIFLNFVCKKIKISSYLPALLVILLVFIESNKFLEDLEKADHFLPAYQLGKFVDSKAEPLEKFVIISKESAKFYGVFLYYYANRSYGIEELSENSFFGNKDFLESNYRFLVVDNKMGPVSEDLLKILDSNYKAHKVGQFRLFDLKK